MTRIIFFGSSHYVLPIISILKQHFDLALVVTTEQKETSPVPAFCKQHNLPYISVQQLNNEAIEQLKSINAPIAVLASFGIIVPKKVLDTFPHGILNIHPSLLPKYRGATPVQSAILNGDTETGVTIIKLDSHMDHGPIVAQEKATIEPHDTADALYERLFHKGAEIIVKFLPEFIEGHLKPTEQNHDAATFTKRVLTREDGYIDIEHEIKDSNIETEKGKGLRSQYREGVTVKREKRQPSPLDETGIVTDKPSTLTPEYLERMIRAYYPWPGVWTKWQMEPGKWKILKFLPEQKLQVEGKKPMSLKDFYNGYPQLKETIEKLF